MNIRTRNNAVTLSEHTSRRRPTSVVLGFSVALALVEAGTPLVHAWAVAPAASDQGSSKSCCHATPGSKGDYLVQAGKRTVWVSTQAAPCVGNLSPAATTTASHADYLESDPSGKRTLWASTLTKSQAEKEAALTAAAANASNFHSTGQFVTHGKSTVWVANATVTEAPTPMTTASTSSTASAAPSSSTTSACKMGAVCYKAGAVCDLSDKGACHVMGSAGMMACCTQ